VAAVLTVAACTSTTTGSGTGPPNPSASASGSSSTVATSASDSASASVAPGELPAAAAIPGLVYHPESDRNHQTGTVHYDVSPPVGGAHSQVWADCTGTVYDQPIASENAVHSLEHGAAWVTYRPDLTGGELAALTDLVQGHDYEFMSPYPGLSAPISAQTWAYQLHVDSATDPRLAQFLDLLRNNSDTSPELGGECGNPQFRAHPSSPGHPVDS